MRRRNELQRVDHELQAQLDAVLGIRGGEDLIDALGEAVRLDSKVTSLEIDPLPGRLPLSVEGEEDAQDAFDVLHETSCERQPISSPCERPVGIGELPWPWLHGLRDKALLEHVGVVRELLLPLDKKPVRAHRHGMQDGVRDFEQVMRCDLAGKNP